MTDMVGPKAYPEVNTLLALLLERVREVLGPRLVGLYLYGSLAGGEFDPESSDVDFLVVTEGEIPEELLPRLEAMHARIAESGLPFSHHLEGSYIPREALRRYDPENARHPTIGVDWPFKVDWHDESWVLNRYLVREQGVTLAGPPPETLIDPISPDELCATVRQLLVTRWARELQQANWMETRYYQAFAVLTMCRALYLLETGRLVPKRVASEWARAHLEPRWAHLAAQALEWRYDHSPGDESETLAFIDYTIERARRWSM